MIYAIEKNLLKGIKLLNSITDQQYSNTSIAPYFSSIGCHVRHILDVYSCIFDGLPTKKIYLNKRNRNQVIELHTDLGLRYFNSIISQLQSINNLEVQVEVHDDLGFGLLSAKYSLAAILMQAHSHTVHHFASIGYIIYQLGIELPDEDFGFNPTTPKLNV